MKRLFVHPQKETKPKAKDPFGDLGKDEKTKGNLDKRPTQGKRLTGATLLAKAMGKLAQEK